jgi:hypothetical protein
MPLDRTRCQPLLQNFDFRRLFIDEVGWDKHTTALEVTLKTGSARLEAIAHKRGFVAWHCLPGSDGRLPDASARRKIEREVTKSSYEHFIVFTDAAKSRQLWQWVRREQGRPLRVREFELAKGQSGAAILQKLDPLFVSLEDEETIDLTAIASRAAANVSERVTKKFYEDFKKQHTGFLKFITGIPNQGDHEWYASVMLNRLMFVYFIQKKGFLEGDTDYLRKRLNALKATRKSDKFYSFYREFLLRLFHEGLGSRSHDKGLQSLIGQVPYLNGGIFDVHEIEKTYGKDIQIPDSAFEAIFDYFDKYHWHLDERPLRADNEINPDVLGYIFEKYINQKQMGAYYTKEDITEYIGKSCIIPFLFDAARAKCRIAFEGADSPTVWDLLRENPDKYIFPAVRHGCDLDLPAEIAKGLDTSKPNLIERRKGWNKPAPSEFALPTETWREVVARRERCAELRRKLSAGEVREINDLITLNLDLRQFAQDLIDTCEGPHLLFAFWQAVSTITILDPTGGSGAFLFAALHILQHLYEACLDRMHGFLSEARAAHGASWKPHPNSHLADFERILTNVKAPTHPNRRYFVLKSIILKNLYAVDIMEEAVEICKLRLFLKLVALVEPDPSKPNYGIEPLPDIDFNIRCGNTLVGYATEEEVKKAISGDMQATMDLNGDWPRIQTALADVQQTFDAFRAAQLATASPPAEHKKELQKRLKALDDELNRHLASEYGVRLSDKSAYGKWLKSHQPFHWFVQFYGIISGGGFDVIIGNPPYVEMSKVKEYRLKNYKTLDSGNLYALCVERSGVLVCSAGYMGVIVPLSGFSTERMSSYQECVWTRFNSLAVSFYSGDAHPSVLFDGVKYRLCIIIASKSRHGDRDMRVSNYLRWYADERPNLFAAKVAHTPCRFSSGFLRFAKSGTKLSEQVASKLLAKRLNLAGYLRRSGKGHTTYHRSPVFWIRSMDFEPYFKSPVKDRSTDHLKDLYFDDTTKAEKAGAFLNSSLFYFWFTVQGNCRNIAGPDIESFPVGDLDDPKLRDLPNVFSKLMADLKYHSKRRVYVYQAAGRVEYDEFYPDQSKPILDEIDTVLAEHYGFTEEELDFIINYDIKYRMGRDGGEAD